MEEMIKNLDAIMLIIRELPIYSVLAFCNTNKTFQEFCKKYSERIYLELSVRDYDLSKKRKNEDFQQFYVRQLSVRGPAFYLTYTEGKDICETVLTDKATTKGNIKFYLDSKIIGKEITLNDLNKSYYAVFGINSLGRKHIHIFPTLDRALFFTSVFFQHIRNFDSSFPYNNAKSIRDATQILREEGRICYFPKYKNMPELKSLIILKKIFL